MDSPGVTDAALPVATVVAVETPPVAAAAPRSSKRGRKAGSKVKCTPWTPAEDAQLTEIVQGKTVSKLVDLWKDAAEQLGTGRTQASVEQHWYYMLRKAGKPAGKENSGAGGTKRKKVESSMRFTFEEEFDEGAEEMRWLAKCDAKGLCYECGAKHHGRAAEYWIEHPQDEGDSIPGVLFCYDCYDDVRSDRRRGLGMSYW